MKMGTGSAIVSVHRVLFPFSWGALEILLEASSACSSSLPLAFAWPSALVFLVNFSAAMFAGKKFSVNYPASSSVPLLVSLAVFSLVVSALRSFDGDEQEQRQDQRTGQCEQDQQPSFLRGDYVSDKGEVDENVEDDQRGEEVGGPEVIVAPLVPRKP